MELTDFLHAGTNSCKLKDDWKFLGRAWSNLGVASLVRGLQNWLSEEWTDGITDFLHVDPDSQKLEADQTFFGWAWSKKKVWQVWSWDYKIGSTSEINQRNELIFVCRYRFRKAKSWFNCFLVGMVKNGHDQLLHETLKSVAS